jgi:5,10-methylenetetrahydromethanopterin reductase
VAIRNKQLGAALWANEPVPRLAAHAQLAESIGLESLWVIDSQLLCRELTVTLTACLMATQTLKMATGVTQPTTRHASVVASMLATLDELAHGRAMLGIGTGFSSLRTIGQRAARIAEVETFVDALRKLLCRQTAIFNGVDAKLTWLDRPVDVPVVVASSGPRMTREAPRFADGVILHHGISDDLLTRALGWLREGMTQVGRPKTCEVSVWVPYCLADNPDSARAAVRPRVAAALVQADPTQFTGAERDAVERLQASYDVAHHASAGPAHAALVPDSLVDRYAIAGSAEQVRAGLLRLLDNPAIDRVILNPQMAGAGAPPMHAVLRDLAGKVLPDLG